MMIMLLVGPEAYSPLLSGPIEAGESDPFSPACFRAHSAAVGLTDGRGAGR